MTKIIPHMENDTYFLNTPKEVNSLILEFVKAQSISVQTSYSFSSKYPPVINVLNIDISLLWPYINYFVLAE